MSKKNNKVCLCCGKKYTYCHTCEGGKMNTFWKNVYHDSNCRTIFNTVVSYLGGSITEVSAKEVLSKCDLSNKESFNETIRDAITVIMSAQNKKAKKTDEKSE